MNAKLLIVPMMVMALGCKGQIALGDDEPALLSADTPAPSSTTDTPAPAPTVHDTMTSTPEPEVVVEIPEFTADQLVTYLRDISQMLVSRNLRPEEITQVQQQGADALEPILRAWATEPAFAENARYMVQQKLKASGDRDGIDFELPGNLVRHIVANDLPWANVLTAEYCVDAAGNQTACDTGAPFAAGVLGTRAFLAGNASRFNLHRASTLVGVFACRIYPMESTLQPYLERQTLIPMFQADTAEEQVVEEAKNGFGNGDGCYACHGQFGAHAQLFVKFDQTGIYRAEANGLQDPTGELGRSVDGLFVSHMNDPTAASSEASQVFGADVSNLAEAAAVIAQSDAFLPCQAGNVIQHVFGLSESAGVDGNMLREIAQTAREIHASPTYADLVVAALTEPRVILSAVGTPNEGGAP